MLFHCEGYSLSPFPAAFLLARGTGGAWNHLNSDRDDSGMRLNLAGRPSGAISGAAPLPCEAKDQTPR